MKDFWISCGHHLLDRNASGGLVVTDEFLKAYFARPELMPPEDACEVERRLHRELLADPRRPVGADEVAAIADADARENWQFVLAFRDLLLRHPTLEAAYLALVRSGSITLPPLFVNQLVHVILRNALDDCDDPFVLRAAELFFRPQRIMLHEQSLLLGDEEVIGGTQADAGIVADVDAGRDRRRRKSTFSVTENAEQLLAAQRPVRHGTRSHRRKALDRRRLRRP